MKKPTARQIKAAADRIRREHPVRYGDKKHVNPDIAAQDQAIRAQLETWGLTWSAHNEFGQITVGRHVWHTALTPHGKRAKLSGRWGDNPVEVELHLRMYDECADDPAGSIEVLEDAETKLYDALRAEERAAEKQARAIERKVNKTEAKYTDTTTSPELLASTVSDGMLF